MTCRNNIAFLVACVLTSAVMSLAFLEPAFGAAARFHFYEPAGGVSVLNDCAESEDPADSGCDLRIAVTANQIVLRALAWADGSGWFMFCCWDGKVTYNFSESVPYFIERQGSIDFSSPVPVVSLPVVAVTFDVSYSAYLGVSPNPLENMSAATAGPLTVGGTGLSSTSFGSISERCHGGTGSNDDIDMGCDRGGSYLYEPPTRTLTGPTWGEPEVGDILQFSLEICESLPPDQRWDCAPGTPIAIERYADLTDSPIVTISGTLGASSYGRGFGDNGGEALACLGLNSSELGWVNCGSQPLLITARLDSIRIVSFPVRDLGDSRFEVLAWDDSFPVPEPASLALMSVGLAGLGFARRRKQ